MLKKCFRNLFLMVCYFVTVTVYAESDTKLPSEQVHIDIHDKASLQRGARLYMNYCFGCHSLKYLRYERMANDLGIVDARGNILKQLVEENLIFPNTTITAPIKTAMQTQDAKQWFGIPPPDLSLMVRVRGVEWIYNYLRSFYSDPSRPLGTNNLIFPDVAMPNVLVNLQGVLNPIYQEKITHKYGRTFKIKEIDHLTLVEKGSMSQAQFDSAVNDLVNFLNYVSEPMKIKRQELGIWVLFFVIIFAVITYSLKSEYWKDIK